MNYFSTIYRLLFGGVIILIAGCTKSTLPDVTDVNATILQVKYACGPACDALAYIVKTAANDQLTPINLSQEFRLNNLPVKISYKNTGKFPGAFTAPNYELIEIIQISR